jgi:ribonuclease HI
MTEKHIINWNCRGFKQNIDEIKMMLRDFNPMALCCQETYFKPNNTIEFRQYNSYHVHSQAVDGRASGGVSVLIKKTIPHRQIILDTNLQAVAVLLSLHKAVTICSIYIPPRYQLDSRELDDLVNQLPSPFILLGDMNAHNINWGNTNTNSKGEKLEKLISDHDLCLWNDGSPTYIHPATGSFSAIDLTICSPSLFLDFEWEVHEDLCGSDHFPTFLHCNNRLDLGYIPKWKLKKADWPELKKLCELELTPEFVVRMKEDPNETFTSTLHNIAEKTIPKTSTAPRKLHKPWWTDECQEAYTNRKKALKEFKKNPTQIKLNKFKLEYARARKIIRASMKTTWREYVSKLNDRTPINKTWDMVRKIAGKNQCSSVKQLEKDGEIITDITEISNTLAKTISSNSSSSNYSNTFQKHKQQQESTPLQFDSDNDEKYNMPFTMKELRDSLHKAHDTSVGPDDIHYQILKHLPDVSFDALLDFFNDIWDDGVFPPGWSEATIIPIPKPGKDHADATNYRPIALTSCICKTFERMINNRLVWHLEHKGILTAYQSGFRKKRSTMDQIIRLESAVREAFIQREHSVAVYFDLEKAYDTTWKHGIMKDLHAAGLRGRMPKLIFKFLSNRTFSVRIGGTISDMYHQEEGVPQGSILSVTLFSLKINSIVGCLLTNIECSLYVDDFLIFYRGKHMPTIERQLQLCLNRLQKWADENGFKFSRTKTVCMHFCQQRKLHEDPTLFLNDIQIPVVKEYKFLGIVFDHRLTFIPHIAKLKIKCQKALNLLKVVSHYDWGADRNVLLRLYRALVRSKLDYGCIVYGSARKSYIKILDTIHNQGLRISLGAFRTSPMESLYVEANEESLYRRRERLAVQYALKLKSLPSNPTYNTIFQPKYKNKFVAKPSVIPTFGIRIHEEITDSNLQLQYIAEHKEPNIPLWTIDSPIIRFDLRFGIKENIDPMTYLCHFHIFQNQYEKYQFLYTDGSKIEGAVGCAALMGRSSLTNHLPTICSIYTAELRAIILAFKLIKESRKRHFVICTDSLSSLIAIKNLQYDHPILLDIIYSYKKCLDNEITVIFCWVPSHVGIPGNERVDALAKTALYGPITQIRVPYSDQIVLLKLHFRKKWQIFWDQQVHNKLQSVHPTLGCYPLSNRERRREQIVLCRLHIGHTYLTHRHLLAGEYPPVCVSCQERLTVEHILIHCAEYVHIRFNYFNVNTLRELFDTVSPELIINFIQRAGLLYLV